MRVIRGLSVVLATLFLIIGIFAVQPISANEPVCGNGIIEPGEVCDNGSQNSDSIRNACRTSCRAYSCGDSIVDSVEHCDDGGDNGNSPNGCRSDCRLPVCGDGILDDGSYTGGHLGGIHMTTVFNEECDDGNSNNADGCRNDCKSCLQLLNSNDNYIITSDTLLCRQVYTASDTGLDGVFVIQYPGVTLDCDGATIIGSDTNVGIYVMQSNNVTIRNCTVTGYKVGIKITNSENVNFLGGGNQLSGNTKPFVKDGDSQLTPPPAPSAGSLGGGNKPIAAKDLPPSQTKSKFQAGAKPLGLVKPSGRSGLKMPARQTKPGKTGKPFPPLGTKSVGGKTGRDLSPTPPTKAGTPPVPRAPAVKPGTIGSPPAQQKTTTSTKTMPVDPYDTKKIPAETPGAPQIQMGR